MDYSFYGGRRGAAFVITEHFASIKGMIEKFSKGNNYTLVNYDEYVIIDTENKNDPDNGKIFRRGYNYQDKMGGAQYVGQIVGPSGLAPKVEMTTIDKVKGIAEEEGFEYRRSEGEYAPTQNLLPGKIGDTFNDSIKWACCSVRDKNNKDTTAYVGFTFPYTVIEYTAKTVDPYYNRNNETADFINENLVKRIDDGKHPFFEKWDISIPKGIHGDTLKNFRIIDATPEDNISAYEGQNEDRAGKQESPLSKINTRKIAVYDYYHYDKESGGEPVSLYLGDYNMISDVAIDNDGTVKIAYTHDNDSVLKNKLKWIKDISITKEGLFTINYNYGGNSTKYQTTLSWINNVTLDENGTIRFKYNDNRTEDLILDKRIKWVKDIQTNIGNKEGEGNQKLHITYNDNTNVDIGNPLNYIMKMVIDPISYHLLVLYSDPAKRAAIVSAGQNATYEGRNDWQDCGSVKSDSGVLIGTNYPLNHFSDSSVQGIINQLNKELPNGFTKGDIDRHGKIITVGDNNQSKMFFAFDYNKSQGKFVGWYFLGMLNTSPGVVAGKENDPVIQQLAASLPIGSVWLIVE